MRASAPEGARGLSTPFALIGARLSRARLYSCARTRHSATGHNLPCTHHRMLLGEFSTALFSRIDHIDSMTYASFGARHLTCGRRSSQLIANLILYLHRDMDTQNISESNLVPVTLGMLLLSKFPQATHAEPKKPYTQGAPPYEPYEAACPSMCTHHDFRVESRCACSS
jgi:hypothetical protein